MNDRPDLSNYAYRSGVLIARIGSLDIEIESALRMIDRDPGYARQRLECARDKIKQTVAEVEQADAEMRAAREALYPVAAEEPADA